MNTYSLKEVFKIARITDPQKIENVKRAAMEIITKSGYKSASIAAIAQRAGVSVGYLYRFYKSKDDLRKDIIRTYFSENASYFFQLLENCETVSENFYNTVMSLFKMAKSDPLQAKFLAVLLLELDVDIMLGDINDSTLDDMLSRIYYVGNKTGEISPEVTKEEIELVFVSIISKYFLTQLKKEDYAERLSEESAKRITELCLKALS